ncbi:MAG: YjgP/YjgQ family permease, partial [Lentisphaerae bacterium]
DRYLAGGFLHYFGLAILALWLIFMVFTLFELAPDIIKHNISPRYVAAYFALLSPQVLQALTPPCTLIASLLVMSILTQRNEIIALKASGVSAYRASLPVLTVCAALVGLMTAWATWVVPPANQHQDRLRFYIKKGRFPQPIELSPMPFIGGHWMYGVHGRIFHFDAFDPAYDEFRNLLILDVNESDMSIRRRIDALRARWDRRRQSWILDSARMWTFSGSEITGGRIRKKVELFLDETPAYFKKYVKKPDYMSAGALAAHIRELAQQGVDVTELQVAWQRKIALAWACLAMGLVGVPFGLSAGRRGALFGASAAVMLGIVYWIGWGFFAQLGKYGYVGVKLAGWGPVGLLAAVGVYALFRVRT